MINMHTKFEVSTITSNKDMKGNLKRKNSRFEPPFGGLRGNAQGSYGLWLDGKRSVDFLLVIIDYFASFHGWCTIKQNLSKSAFGRVGHCER